MSNTIVLIGLGPARKGMMSLDAWQALHQPRKLILRTAVHPAADDLRAEGIPFDTLDDLYEKAATFEEVYDAAADRVLRAAAEGEVGYALPGHPLIGEASVRLILQKARALGIPVHIVGSASFIEAALTALAVPIGAGIVIQDALALDARTLRPDLDLLIYQVYDRATASSVKLALMAEYPDEAPIRIVRSAGVPGAEAVDEVPLHQLDRMPVDHLTAVFVPALPPPLRRTRFEDLVDVMARLRGPGGCPWDREQNHRTLERYLVEECYEVLDAIEAEDPDALAEELGDVLLQVVFHAQLAAEEGVFDIRDVIARIVEKLVRRHPHVFGDAAVANADEVLRNWEAIKRSEKGPEWRKSVLDGIPKRLPALMRAMEMSKRAAKVGFEWERLEDVFEKVDEELQELREAVAAGRAEEVREELGDLLFALVNIARWQRVDPEEALRTMLARFATRFRWMEERAKSEGRDLKDYTLKELDELWGEAKRLERKGIRPGRTETG
ncbi:MAG: nucleoside triphosphate pyrophosphohydrolase [Chthonomonadales bacterium]